MPLNNCVQCTSITGGARFRIVGYAEDDPLGGCNWTELRDCQKSNLGYGRNETSVADLMGSSTSEVTDYEVTPTVNDIENGIDEIKGEEATDYQEGSDQCLKHLEVYSRILKKCVPDLDMTDIKCKGNIDPENTSFATFSTWSVQSQKCVMCKIGQYWDDDHQVCEWINDELDDLPDYFPCDGVECGTGGACEEGVCVCHAGYEHEDESDLTSKCVKIPAPAIDPDELNTFELEQEFKINNNTEYSFLALAISFNPAWNDEVGGTWKGHINKDLPIWRAGQVHSGAKLPATLEYKGGPLKNYAGKVPPKKYINPILHEMFCGGKTLANAADHLKYGTWYGDNDAVIPAHLSDAGEDDSRRFNIRTAGKYDDVSKSSPFKYCFPGKGPAEETIKTYKYKTGDTIPTGKKVGDKYSVTKKHSRQYIPKRWGYCYEHNTDGANSNGDSWLFCAAGVSYTMDLFRMKYFQYLNTGEIPGGNGLGKGDTGSYQCVAKNAKNGGGSKYYEKNDETFVYWHKKEYVGSKLTDTKKNIAKMTRISNWKGAIFAYNYGKGGHIGIVMHIENPSTPSKCYIWTLEFNTKVNSSGSQDGAQLAFNRRRVRGRNYWKFSSTEHIFGGTWAPNGLGDHDYIKDLLGVEGNPDWDNKTGTEEVSITKGEGANKITTVETKLSSDTIKSYFN